MSSESPSPSPVPSTALAAFEERIGYTFKQRALLSQALTHASCAGQAESTSAHNQRLEFLGDAVLHLALTVALFRLYPSEREGALSKRRAALSKGGFLSQLARGFALSSVLQVSASEAAAGGHERDAALEDALEALIGAIYLDSDWPTAQATVLRWYGSLEERLVHIVQTENPKGRLQELIQPVHGNNALSYKLVNTTGPKHGLHYEVAIFLGEKQLGVGCGSSKKTAEEEAAREALRFLTSSAG